MREDQARGESRTLTLTVALYVFIVALKVAAYLVSGLVALLAEALHTLSDIFISGFLLIALRYSRKPADAVHMFGYGRAQNAAALVAATLFISFTSYTLYVEAIPRLLRPGEGSYEALPLAAGVLAVSMLIAAVPLAGFLRRRPTGASGRAQMLELINDELGLAAALTGTLLAWRGRVWADPLAAIIVATVIAYNGIRLFRENLDLLLGRSPGPDFLRAVEQAARSVEGVLSVHELRAEVVGPDLVHAGMHITVAPGTPIEEAERIVEQVKHRVHAGTEGGYCFIQVEAADAMPA